MSDVVEVKDEVKKKRRKSEGRKSLGILLSLIILCAIISVLSPRFLTIDNLRNVTSQATVSAIVSIGLFLAILTGGIDLSVGSILALSIMMMGIFQVKMGINSFLSMLLCLGVGSLMGLINGLLLTKLKLPHPFISTMGTQKIARGLSLAVTAAAPISGFAVPVQFLGSRTIGPVPASVLLVIVLYVIMFLFLTHTATGRYIYAVGGNVEASRLSGINVDRVLCIVYTISGFMAALAGIVLVGRVNAAYPLAGQDYETDAIAAVIIGGSSFSGGVGKIYNTVIGVLIIAVLRNGLNLLNVDSAWQTVAIGVVIILAVYLDVIRQKKAVISK
ncbi:MULTISPECIES: ABC transporter permease [Sphaerochaeta]|jgi:ribose transport system permease protein|uniref:ABC transporter permease n=1 Tax=Sphaerochaeta associata TaxID=1129264 RepID=A0ABY4DCF1_9SPIR|nr:MULTISPECIES: ABC transporter permease [Sphaerochaeta]NCC14260.1 ABC transporter permease [Spirochaetia bacterium]MDD2394959.1 ABC transporter permease [Sphaerochaeta sp.]MDD3456872.1 ABC transporter permease [Sphaerochaeta sp.]MDX9982888.1 ABC transporter permease [Sphaerochaeta sp.]UOM51719.1 ABC transporter permease [Sphaerochaeta associata]